MVNWLHISVPVASWCPECVDGRCSLHGRQEAETGTRDQL
jgi:hypothetical protein